MGQSFNVGYASGSVYGNMWLETVFVNSDQGNIGKQTFRVINPAVTMWALTLTQHICFTKLVNPLQHRLSDY